jgi:hypothetical protein
MRRDASSKKMRRFFAATLGTLLVSACSDDPSKSAANDDSGGAPARGGSSGAAAAGGTSSGGTSGSDAGGDGGAPPLPYANVTAVVVTGEPGAYTFAVSVESADIDCSQYADWWEVLSGDGALSYRRILEHSHTDENGTTDADAPGNTFTRPGGPVDVLADDTLVVRAHMSNGGYNGDVLRGTVTDGFVLAADVGSDFAADVEDDAPLPTSCSF